MLFDFTDAAVVILLDNDPNGEIGRVWGEALGHAGRGADDAALRSFRRLESIRGEAARWLRELGERALRSHQLDRLAVHVLAKPDIIEYLPVGMLVPGATSWGPVVADWRKAHASGDDRGFKPWLHGERRATLSESALRKAAETLDDLQDLGIFAGLVDDLSRPLHRYRPG